MVGKRVQKRKMRAPAVLVLLAAMLAVLTTAGPRGVAADSPLESAAEPAVESTAPAARDIPAEAEEAPAEPEEAALPEPFASRRAGRWKIHILKTPRFWGIPGPRASTCTAG